MPKSASSSATSSRRSFNQNFNQNLNKNKLNKNKIHTHTRAGDAAAFKRPRTAATSAHAGSDASTKRPRTAPSTTTGTKKSFGKNSSTVTRYSSLSVVSSSTGGNPRSNQQLSQSRPGTATTRPTTATTAVTDQPVSIIMALAESRGSGCEIGLAALDLRTSSCWFLQLSDTPAYARTLHQLILTDPDEIVVPDTLLASDVNSKLLLGIDENLGSAVRIRGYNRRDFQSGDGRELFERYATDDALIAGGPLSQNKYYALAALAALISFVNEHHAVEFTEKSLNIRYHTGDGLMTIDSSTAKNLELVKNIRDHTKNQMTLLSAVKHTQTQMGTRLLRTNLLQPLADQKSIELRLDAVDELLGSPRDLFSIKSALKTIAVDIDYLITAVIRVPKTASVKYTEQCINNVLQLRQLLGFLPSIVEPLGSFKSGILVAIHDALSSLGTKELLERIAQTINEDLGTELKTKNQRIQAVKSGFNGLLDVARQTYNEVADDIHALHQRYNQENTFAIKLKQSGQQFLLHCSTDQVSESTLPSTFINVTKCRKTLTFTSLDLLKLNERLQESLTEIFLMSDEVVQELMMDIRKSIACFYKVSESIALLDMLLSFAHYASKTNPSVRPEFEETLAIKQGKHPIRAAFEMSGPCVPNDTYAYNGTDFQIITGPNMSGKSTYLRQVALLNVLAHIGSYVPAEFASFRILKQLMSRLSNDDSIANNSSTFMTEMRDMSFILQNISSHSLVVIDELGRGTSTYDALGITCALCEKLIASSAIVLFATHFMELVDVLDVYPNVVNLHLRVEHKASGDHGYKYLYKIEGGPTKEAGYGLALAYQMKFPEPLMAEAQAVFDTLQTKQRQIKRSMHSLEAEKRKLHIQMLDQMIQAHGSIANENNLKKFIKTAWTGFREMRAMTIE